MKENASKNILFYNLGDLKQQKENPGQAKRMHIQRVSQSSDVDNYET